MKRQKELDLLRLVAFLCVTALHICSGVQETAAFLSANWLMAQLLRVTWAVPVFVMVSGGFFLQADRALTVKQLWGKYILRLGTAFALWSVVYQLYYLSRGSVDGWKSLCAGLVDGAYHMWYLWMLAGLYAAVPVLRRIAEDRKTAVYYLMLALGVQCLTFFLPLIPGGEELAEQVLGKLHPELFLGFSSYFLLGHVLRQWKPDRRQAGMLYAAGILAAMIAVAGDIALSGQTGEAYSHLTRYLSPLTAVQAAAVYVFFLRWGERHPRPSRWLEKIGSCGLGAYLIHALILELFKNSPMWKLVTAAPLVGIPLLTVAAAAISIGLAMVLRKIPCVGKYIA